MYEQKERAGVPVSNNMQEFYSLTGDYMSTKMFKHNNMVPFNGGKPKGQIYNNNNAETILDNYVGKNTRITEKEIGNGFKEVCDLDTGDCYSIRMKDGLIERVDNTLRTNRKINVETTQGFKQLLNG